MSDHTGHRARLRTQLAQQGMDCLNDEQLLALILFHVFPRGDTAPIARRLIGRFQTIAHVVDANMEELCSVEGVGPQAAYALRLIPQLERRLAISRASTKHFLPSVSACGKMLMPYFKGEQEEAVYLLLLDAKYMYLDCKLLHRGSVHASAVTLPKVLRTALNGCASSVVIAHNHPGGLALPSFPDYESTRRFYYALASVGVELYDHIVVADNDFVSMRDDGFIAQLAEETDAMEQTIELREREDRKRLRKKLADSLLRAEAEKKARLAAQAAGQAEQTGPVPEEAN